MAAVKQSNVQQVVEDINQTFDKDSSKSDRNNYKFYCDVCSYGTAKSPNYYQHLKAKRHAENVKNKKENDSVNSENNIKVNSGPVVSSKTLNDLPILKSNNVPVLESKKTVEVIDNVEKGPEKQNHEENRYYCEVCDLKANSQYNYDSHLKSKKHLKNVAESNDVKKGSNGDKNKSENDSKSNGKEKAQLVINRNPKEQENSKKEKESMSTPSLVKLQDEVSNKSKPENGISRNNKTKSVRHIDDAKMRNPELTTNLVENKPTVEQQQTRYEPKPQTKANPTIDNKSNHVKEDKTSEVKEPTISATETENQFNMSVVKPTAQPANILITPVVEKALENSKFAKPVPPTTATKKKEYIESSKYSPITIGNIWGMNKETQWTNMNSVFQSFSKEKSQTPVLSQKVQVFGSKSSVPDAPQILGPKAVPTKSIQRQEIPKDIPQINFDDIKDKDEEEVEFECKDCMEAFWFRDELLHHFKDVHGVDDPEVYQRNRMTKEMPRFVQKQTPQFIQKQKPEPVIQAFVVENSNNSNNAMRFVCEVCNVTFDDKRSLTRHLQTKKHEDNKILINSQKKQKEQQYQSTNMNPQQYRTTNSNGNSQQHERVITNANLNPQNNQNMNQNTRSKPQEVPIVQNRINAPQQPPTSKRPLPLSNQEKAEERPASKAMKTILVDDEENDFICKYAGCMKTFWYDKQLQDHIAAAHK